MIKKFDAAGDRQLNEEERVVARKTFEQKRSQQESGDAD